MISLFFTKILQLLPISIRIESKFLPWLWLPLSHYSSICLLQHAAATLALFPILEHSELILSFGFYTHLPLCLFLIM